MELSGKVSQILPLQTGISQKSGAEWRRQDVIVETEGQYTKKICVSLWSDNIPKNPLNVGDMLKMSIDIESREFNGKWYTSVKAWKVENMGGGMANDMSATPSSTTYPSDTPSPALGTDANASDNEEEDDLPF